MKQNGGAVLRVDISFAYLCFQRGMAYYFKFDAVRALAGNMHFTGPSGLFVSLKFERVVKSAYVSTEYGI